MTPSDLSDAISLNGRIAMLEGELELLYAERAGALMEHVAGWGWCCVCGRNGVNCAEGWDTCSSCAGRI